ncbi:MAG: hypothetical protein FJX75_00560 [Armatimonadetes bacterium]|nr:hypothetical protein [Armatimonadota bacterium]
MTQPKSPGWLLWGVLLLIVLAQTQAALAKDLKDGPFVSGADVFAALLFGVWALWALGTGAWRRVKWPPLAAGVLVAVAIVAVGRADSPEALKSGIVDVAQYVLYFVCAYLLFLNAITDETRVKWVVGLLGVLTALMVLVALAQYILWADPADPGETFRRVSSTFGLGEVISKTPLGHTLHLAGKSSRSIYCNYLLLVLPVLFSLGLRGSGWVRPALLTMVALGMLTMLSGWHFWALAAILIALSLRRSVRTALIVAAAVVAFTALGPWALPRNHEADVVELMDWYEEGVRDETAITDESFRGGELPTTTEVKKRWVEWQPALNMVRANPVLGVGTGGYQLHIGQNYGMLPNFEKIEPDTNCGWLVIAGSMGLCGLIALAALLYAGYRTAVVQSTKGPTEYLRALSAGLAGSMLGVFLAMLFSSVLVRGLSLTLILLLALVSVVEELAKAPVGGGETSRPRDLEDRHSCLSEFGADTPNGG